jgi:6-pyruvoyltetrahydropterin/6-carboxytetrahydropterin synthase
MYKVIVHETATGYAECTKDDFLNDLRLIGLIDLEFSDAIKTDWKYNFIDNASLPCQIYPDAEIYDNNCSR